MSQVWKTRRTVRTNFSLLDANGAAASFFQIGRVVVTGSSRMKRPHTVRLDALNSIGPDLYNDVGNVKRWRRLSLACRRMKNHDRGVLVSIRCESTKPRSTRFN